MDLKLGQLVVGSTVVCVPLRPENNPLVFNMGARWMVVVVPLNGNASKHLLDIETYTMCLDRILKDGEITQEEHTAFMGQVPELTKLGLMSDFKNLIELACERANLDLMDSAGFQSCDCGEPLKHGELFVGERHADKVFCMEDLFRQCEFYTSDGTITSLQAFGIMKQAHDMGLPEKSPLDPRTDALLEILQARFIRPVPAPERSAAGPT